MAEHDHEHGECLCGGDPLADHEVTNDCDLPAALGGVQGDRKPRQPKRRSDKTAVGNAD